MHVCRLYPRIDIDRLRTEFTETQDLYREVCVLLFFRYGITPTANKLYQLVRKGSMSAPTEALSKFWTDLREKSRLRIEHPDLPEALKTAAGELTATLWGQAQSLAHENLGAYRSESQTVIDEARLSVQHAEARVATLQQDLNTRQCQLTQLTDQLAQQGQALAAEQARNEGLTTQVEDGQRQQTIIQAALDNARREFAIELDKLRAALSLAEERYQTADDRALREIDRERTLAHKLQKELEQSRALAAKTKDQHRSETATLQAEINTVRHRLGTLEGSLAEMRTLNIALSKELDSTRQQFAEAMTAAATAKGEASILKGQLELLAKPRPKSNIPVLGKGDGIRPKRVRKNP